MGKVMTEEEKISGPRAIEVRGARVHNLKNVDVDVPLHKVVGIAGVSGSGKSSLALGVLYAEGSRRYLDALSAYTRRRMTQAEKAQVDDIRYIPPALALRQRPAPAGMRSTFGTSSELLNPIRLMFSRLSSHVCPNGHIVPPSLAVAAEKDLICPVCGAKVWAASAEDLSFNSTGACPACHGTGIVRRVKMSALVPDDTLTIDEGAVAPWGQLMWTLMKDIARKLGVRTDVPFKDLTDKEKDIVFHGPAKKVHLLYHNEATNTAGEMDFTYFNAVYSVENALSRVKDEKGMKRVAKFLEEGPCPECGGSRLSKEARSPKILGIGLDEASKMTLSELEAWVDKVPESLPEDMRPMAQSIVDSFHETASRLMKLGLSYLSLDRPAVTLSNGERQRMQLARSVRNRTSGALYVLDEPSIGLHPLNIEGLKSVVRELVADGNSVVLVDHDTNALAASDWIIEMGPASGAGGGRVIGEGSVPETIKNPASQIGPFLSGKKQPLVRQRAGKERLFELGEIAIETGPIHTVKPLSARFPKGRMTAVTGVSGSGKTTLILESLVPALRALNQKWEAPAHVRKITAPGIKSVKLIDATPIGVNVRSTVATYANVHDELRKVFAKLPAAKDAGLKAGDFSYNTGSLRCPECDGTGSISLDIQFLPDVEITCPACSGTRYKKEAGEIKRADKLSGRTASLPELMAMDAADALEATRDLKVVQTRLGKLTSLGLGYLTLGEATPVLSGGEAQRLKLAEELGRAQEDSLFVFDEPTIGLHPKDVQTLLKVFDALIRQGATVIVIEHDTDLIENADYVIDMGPGGGEEGGEIVACGTPEEIAGNPKSATGRFLKF